MFRWILTAPVLFLFLTELRAGEEPPAVPVLRRLPVREATVFKDGYAFVLHRGSLPTDTNGQVVLDYLPNPVLGTFWPASFDPKARLQSVTAARRRVQVSRTALTLRDLLEANVGAEVSLVEDVSMATASPATFRQHSGTILGFLNRSGEELAATAPPHTEEGLAQKGQLILLKSPDGVRVLSIDKIRHAKFNEAPQIKATEEEFRHLLTLSFDWGGQPPAKSVDVGMAYLQRGLRWIPNYRIELDNQGQARVQLQATILNELTDLDQVTLHLVIGVPSFDFKETIDPIAMNQTLARLSPYFQNDASTQMALSNAIMTQTARMGEVRGRAPEAAVDLGPELAGPNKNEDLFVFTMKNITLKKGQRMTLPVTQITLPYKDVFTLHIPYGPPPQMVGRSHPERSEAIRRLLATPKVQYKVRLTNNSQMPLTTAPALILKNQQLLGQGMMTYTSPSASVDLTVTSAIDIKVTKRELETKRTPRAMQFEDTSLTRVDVSGTIQLTNLRAKPVEVEVIRYIMGQVQGAGDNGKAEMVHAWEDDDPEIATRPSWWGHYSWPHWWDRVNGIGRFQWAVRLETGKSVELRYTWHYLAP
jgi:hypothetical protein